MVHLLIEEEVSGSMLVGVQTCVFLGLEGDARERRGRLGGSMLFNVNGWTVQLRGLVERAGRGKGARFDRYVPYPP